MTESEYRSPTILDSRRLFGPNRFSVRAGAVLEVECGSASAIDAVARWSDEARRLTTALGWHDMHTVTVRARASANLFVSAPVDGLMTATDLTEYAWVAAEARVAGAPGADVITADAIAVLRAQYAKEREALPHLVAIAHFADARDINFSLDDEFCSVGSGGGVGVVAHADAALDDAASFQDAWSDTYDVPIALVTGSNGKTTTTRLVAAMSRAAGRCTGWNCSDGVWVDDEVMAVGDMTGPTGARTVITDRRVETAILETARGGMLRRGLAVNRVHGAVITNISPDHFGEYGVDTLEDLADAKAIVARALRPNVPLVLNADDRVLRELALRLNGPVVWFSTTGDTPPNAVASAFVREGRLLLRNGKVVNDLGAVSDMPITLGGHAAHNIANAAGAALLASVLGIPHAAIRQALAHFGASVTDNPGRLMVREFGGITVVMDYAHNPDGIASLGQTAATMPAKRRLLLFGQAGDRDDTQLAALARAAWSSQPFDRVIVKELPTMLRGRPAGEIPAVLIDALIASGASLDVLSAEPNELAGVRSALAWARAGDLLVLGVHTDRTQVLSLVDQLIANNWRAGDSLPGGPT